MKRIYSILFAALVSSNVISETLLEAEVATNSAQTTKKESKTENLKSRLSSLEETAAELVAGNSDPTPNVIEWSDIKRTAVIIPLPSSAGALGNTSLLSGSAVIEGLGQHAANGKAIYRTDLMNSYTSFPHVLCPSDTVTWFPVEYHYVFSQGESFMAFSTVPAGESTDMNNAQGSVACWGQQGTLYVHNEFLRVGGGKYACATGSLYTESKIGGGVPAGGLYVNSNEHIKFQSGSILLDGNCQ